MATPNFKFNQLVGVIPISLGNLNEFTHLDVSNNELLDDLPLSLSNMVNIVGLYVQQNKHFGSIYGLLLEGSS